MINGFELDAAPCYWIFSGLTMIKKDRENHFFVYKT